MVHTERRGASPTQTSEDGGPRRPRSFAWGLGPSTGGRLRPRRLLSVSRRASKPSTVSDGGEESLGHWEDRNSRQTNFGVGSPRVDVEGSSTWVRDSTELLAGGRGKLKGRADLSERKVFPIGDGEGVEPTRVGTRERDVTRIGSVFVFVYFRNVP